jgi:hypothetical protein
VKSELLDSGKSVDKPLWRMTCEVCGESYHRRGSKKTISQIERCVACALKKRKTA